MSYAIIDLKQKKFFSKIDVNVNNEKVDIKIPEFKEKKQIKVANQVNAILKRYKISNVVLNENLKDSIDFQNTIMKQNHYIITGKKMYKVLLPTMIEDISKLIKFQKEKLNVAILIDEYNADNIELIKIISDEVKNVSLITNNAYRFEELVNELLRSKGIVVELLNKSKVNLKRKHIIINIDFSEKDIEKLNIPPEVIIITNNPKIQNLKSNFNGIIVRDVDIYLNGKEESNENTEGDELKREENNGNIERNKTKKEENNKNIKERNFRTLELCEANLYNYMKRIKENEEIFKKSIYKVNGYIGNNGKVAQEDFERIGKIFLKSKKREFSKISKNKSIAQCEEL